MILTPQQLWKDYNRFETPFNISQLSQKADDLCMQTYYYFNGDKARKGNSRIFARLVDPIAGRGDSVIIVFDDIANSVDKFDCSSYIANGYSVLVIDYAGEIGDKTRYTIYPTDLEFANASSDNNNLNNIKITAEESCWYVWAKVGFRAVAFAESLGFEKRFAIGVGHGGEQVWKICYDQTLLQGACVVFSGGAEVYLLSDAERSSQDSLAYFAGISSLAYAPLVKTPMFMQVTSNEQNSSLDYLNNLYNACTNNSSYISISSRSNRTIQNSKKDGILTFFNSSRDNEVLLSAPSISFKGSDNNLYLSTTVEDSSLIQSIELNVAYSQQICAYRNWRRIDLEKIGNDYYTLLPVVAISEPIYTFLNITLTNGFSFSSSIQKVKPEAYSIKCTPFSSKRLVYDVDMGVADWIVLNENSLDYSLNKPVLKMGCCEIEGVTSPTNVLTTFKLADIQYKGKDNYLLQMIVFSDSEQNVTFSVTSAGSLKKYLCTKNITNVGSWSKITLDISDFKSGGSFLDSWEDILTFEITSCNELLVNSLLWV